MVDELTMTQAMTARGIVCFFTGSHACPMNGLPEINRLAV
jgi:hypothetical protein